MIKVLSISFLLLISSAISCYGIDSALVKNIWSLEAGVSIVLPFQNTDERYGFDCFDCQQGEFSISPQVTAGSFYINAGYTKTHFNGSKVAVGSKFSGGILHFERKIVKDGSYCCGEFPVSFEGKITNIKRDDFFFLGYGINVSVPVGKSSLITNQLNLEMDFLIHESTNSDEQGTHSLQTSSNRWPLSGPSVNMSYILGMSRILNERFIFNSGFKIPITVVNSAIGDDWQKEDFRTSPWLVSAYSKPGSNFTFFLISAGLIFII